IEMDPRGAQNLVGPLDVRERLRLGRAGVLVDVDGDVELGERKLFFRDGAIDGESAAAIEEIGLGVNADAAIGGDRGGGERAGDVVVGASVDPGFLDDVSGSDSGAGSRRKVGLE